MAKDRTVWSGEQLATLGRLYPHMATSEVAAIIGLPVDKVYAKANFLGIKKTEDYLASAKPGCENLIEGGKAFRFKRGHTTWNKGTKGIQFEGMQATQFKKGNRPHTWVPVGTYRVNHDGRLEVKLNDDPGPYHVRWKPVHRHVWEQAHGPIPKGMVVAFKDGKATTDLASITLDALECISQAEMMRRNTIHNLPPELVDVTRLRAVLTRAINKREKHTS